MADHRKKCPECSVMVKEANLDGHLQRVHGVSLENSGKESAGAFSQKMVSVIIAVMIVAVSIFGYYWIVVNEGDLGRMISGQEDTIPSESQNQPIIPAPDDGSQETPDDTPDDSGSTLYAIISVQGYSQNIVVALAPDRAPVTVENFVKYAETSFFNGLIFHRVMENFMIQGGGFYPDMTQKPPTYSPIINEASKSQMRNLRGTIAMARTNDPNSATSQFFINHADNAFLDWDQSSDGYGYCVFGTVVEGMGVVDAIAGVPTHSEAGQDDVPVTDVIITSVTIDYR